MKKAIKNRWIKALRSGEYQQAKGRLQTENGDMCCLGVLYDIQFDGYWILNEGSPRWSIEGRDAIMSLRFQESVGLLEHEESVLTCMNDRGCSFNQIADYIEEVL